MYLSSGLYGANLVSSDQIDTDTAAGTYTYYYHPQYTVTFDLGGGSFTGSTTAKTVGGLLTSLPMPTKAGYLFTGWSTTSGAISESAKYWNSAIFTMHRQPFMRIGISGPGRKNG